MWHSDNRRKGAIGWYWFRSVTEAKLMLDLLLSTEMLDAALRSDGEWTV